MILVLCHIYVPYITENNMAWFAGKQRKKITIAAAFLGAAGLSYAVFAPQVGIPYEEAREKFYQGTVQYNAYQFSSAADFYYEALALNPDFHESRRMLGQALYFSGQVDEAVSEWQIILDRGGYDPALKLHLQNLQSAQIVTDPKYVFRRIVKPVRGFRYSYPSYISQMPQTGIYLLSLGQLDVGNMITLNAAGDYDKNYRRISEKISVPMGAAASDKVFWVSDHKTDVIHRMNINEGPKLFSGLDPLGGPGNEKGLFRGPAGICYSDGFFYIADSGNNRIQKYNHDGELQFSFSTTANGFRLNYPFGVACAAGGKVYVSEPLESRISVFDEFGNFLEFVGDTYLGRPRHLNYNREKNTLVVADEKHGVYLINLSTRQRKHITGYREDERFLKFIRPYAAAYDSYGNLYIADYGAHQIVQFTPEQMLYSNLDVWVERVDSRSFPMVGLWVSVKDHYNNYITDIDSESFMLTENNANVGRLRADYLDQFQDRASWVILISKSERMKNYRDSYTWLADFFISELREKDKVKVISYADTTREDSEFTNSRLRLLEALHQNTNEDYKTASAMAVGRALYRSVDQLVPEKGRRAVIYITDGDLSDEGLADYSLTRIKAYAANNHIPVFVISYEHPDVENRTRSKERLKELTKETQGRYYYAYGNLSSLKDDLLSVKEQRYVLNYRSLANSDWHKQYMELKLNVKFQGRTGFETAGYFIPEED